MHHRYQALRTISFLSKTTAGLTLVVTLALGALLEMFATDHVVGAALSVAVILLGTVGTLLLFALAEGIKVVLDIESNTRAGIGIDAGE
jgi:hypothetical protein